MNNRVSILVILASALALAAVALPAVHAQDPAVVAPEIYKCTFENEHTRVCEVTFAPGATIAPHSHPQHLAYVLAGGKIRITVVGGEPQEVELTPGASLWTPAETHHAENIGATEVKLLVVEFRDLPAPSM